MGTVPPGAASVVITNSSGTIPLYVGAGSPGTAPTLASNGTPIPGGGIVTLAQFPSSSSTRLYGLAQSGTIPVGLIISTGA